MATGNHLRTFEGNVKASLLRVRMAKNVLEIEATVLPEMSGTNYPVMWHCIP